MPETILLLRALEASGSPDFENILKQEIEALGADRLPLVQALTAGNYIASNAIQAMILAVTQEKDCIRVKAGIFFEGILAGCSCADDPTPVEPQSEYCEIQFDIDRATARASVSLLP